MTNKAIITLITACFTASLTNIAIANSEYDKWLRQTQDTFQAYKDKRDKEFTQFLNKQWKEIVIQPPLIKDNTPKPLKDPVLKVKTKTLIKKKSNAVIVKVPKFELIPDTLPKFASQETESTQKKDTGTKLKKPAQIDVPEFSFKPAPPFEKFEPDSFKSEKSQTPLQKPDSRVIPTPASKEPVTTQSFQAIRKLPAGRTIEINYFGHDLKFSYDPKMKTRMRGRINKNTISRFWSNLSQTDYELLEQQFNSQRQPLALNDWGYVLLVNKVAQEVYPDNSDAASMFTWFFLIKAGYMARIAYDSNHVYLLLPSKQVIKQSRFTFGGEYFYPLNLETGKAVRTYRVKTYDGQYPGATTKLNMQVSRSMNTGRQTNHKTLDFSYARKKYRIKVDYDRNTVDFFNTYPAMDYYTYFSAEVSQQTGHPILTQLGKIINGKSEEEAVNILMRFTQTAFKYKTDDKQFGTENYLFPEETLHYKYSDCEDRVFMFAWLVRNLLKLKVVGLKYPGHFSAAVKFNEKVSGQSVRFKGTRYMITEPTYKGGRVGQAPPQHKKARPKVAAITS